jgi:RNA-dependent RNA polymerase
MCANFQPTFWNTYRWKFKMNAERLKTLRKCAANLRGLAQDDPQMNILSKNRLPMWDVVQLSAEQVRQFYTMPKEIKSVRFSTRTLIEGLVAYGILRPGNVLDLLKALAKHAVVPAFQDRILESFFKEDRIKDVTRLVPGKSTAVGLLANWKLII